MTKWNKSEIDLFLKLIITKNKFRWLIAGLTIWNLLKKCHLLIAVIMHTVLITRNVTIKVNNETVETKKDMHPLS